MQGSEVHLRVKRDIKVGTLIGIIAGGIVAFVIIVALIILIICKCCVCSCCEDGSDFGGSRYESHMPDGELKRPIPDMDGEYEPPVKTPLEAEPYRGALEMALNPATLQENKFEAMASKEREPGRKKNKRPGEFEAPPTNPAAFAPQSRPELLHPKEGGALQVAEGEQPPLNGFQQPPYAEQLDLLNSQMTDGPLITATAATESGDRQFLPHLNIAAPPVAAPTPANRYYGGGYDNYNDNFVNKGVRRTGTMPGARPLPGMANSTEYKNAFDRKLPRF